MNKMKLDINPNDFKIGEQAILAALWDDQRIYGKIAKVRKKSVEVILDGGEKINFTSSQEGGYLVCKFDIALYRSEQDLLDKIESRELEGWICKNLCYRIESPQYDRITLIELRAIKKALEEILEDKIYE